MDSTGRKGGSPSTWQWLMPWIAAGLAVALAVVYLRPDLLRPAVPAADRATTPGIGAAAEPAASTATGSADQPAVAPEPAPASTDGAVAPPNGAVDFTRAVAASSGAVVNISTQRVVRARPLSPQWERLFGERSPYSDRVQRSLGSGVIYDRRGHVLTNHHVVAGAQLITVGLKDGREVAAELVGQDPDTDLAVLRIRLNDLPQIPLGRSDRLQVGEPVLAIGNPLGLGQTATSGIISAVGRGRVGVSTFENFIQTDAAINFGNSGGALVNARGELIGLNTAMVEQGAGIGFAIPVDLVRGVADELIANGRVLRGWIGVLPVDVPRDQSEQFGLPPGAPALVGVYRGSPAETAGLRANDVVTEVNGRKVADAQDLRSRIAMLKPGDTARVTWRRGESSITVKMTVAARPTNAAQSS